MIPPENLAEDIFEIDIMMNWLFCCFVDFSLYFSHFDILDDIVPEIGVSPILLMFSNLFNEILIFASDSKGNIKKVIEYRFIILCVNNQCKDILQNGGELSKFLNAKFDLCV